MPAPGHAGLLELLHVLRRELRRLQGDGELVDLAGELEGDLVVLVVDGYHTGSGLLPP
jgi:hypothetical protein